MLANSPPHPNTDFALFDDPLILLLYRVQPCQIVILEPSIFWRQLFCVKWLFWAVIFSGIKANDYFIISFTCVVQFCELRITRCSHSSWFEGTSPGFLLFFFIDCVQQYPRVLTRTGWGIQYQRRHDSPHVADSLFLLGGGIRTYSDKYTCADVSVKINTCTNALTHTHTHARIFDSTRDINVFCALL